MRKLALVVALLLSAALSFGQMTVTQLQFFNPLPVGVTGGDARVVGATGAATIYYWIYVRYPGGAVAPYGPVVATGTVGIALLNAMDYVALNWGAVPGASGYDIVRQATQNPFDGARVCANCAVSINQAATTFNDIGGGVVNWPPAGYVMARTHYATLMLLGQSETTPYMDLNVDGVSGRILFSSNWTMPLIGVLNLTAPPGGSTGINIYGPTTQAIPLIDMHADADAELRIGAHGAGVSVTETVRVSRGTFAAPVIVNNGDRLGGLIFQGYTGAAYAPAASIVSAVDAAPGAGDMPGSLSFTTTPDGTAAVVERLHIANTGIVTVTTSELRVEPLAGGYLDWSTKAGVVSAVRSQVGSTFAGGVTTMLRGGDFAARSLIGAAPGFIVGVRGYTDTAAGTVGNDLQLGTYGIADASVGIIGGASGARGDMLISGTATMAGPGQTAFGVKGYFDDALGLTIATNYTAAVAGWISDRNTAGPTGAVIAYLDGGGVRTAPNNPTSAFRVVDANAGAGIGFQYGLDLYWTNGAGLSTVLEVADIRGQNADVISNSAAGTWRLQRDNALEIQETAHSAVAPGTSPTYSLRRSRGTAAAEVIVVNGDTIGSLIFAGNNGVAGTYLPAASIVAGVDDVPGAADMPGNLVFSTTLNGAAAVTERLRISNAGVITATSTQTIVTADVAADARLEVHNDGAAVAVTQTLRRSRGTLAAPTIVVNGDTVGSIIFQGSNNNAAPTYLPAASIVAEIDAAVAGGGAADMPGRLIFSTTPDAAGAVVERLRISNAGIFSFNTNQLVVSAAGVATTYAALATAGLGVPPVLVTYSALNQAAAIGAANLLAAAPAGQYRTSAYFHTTVADGAACTATLILGWTYNGGAKTKNLVAAHDLNVDEAASDNLTTIMADAGTNITREVTRGGACAGASRYDVYVTLERLQ